MLVKLDNDTIAFLSLIASIFGVVVGLVSAVAAIFAAFYAKKAATKDDLAGVEQKTQYVEHVGNKVLSIDIPIHPQEEQESPQVQAQQETPQVQAQQEARQVQAQQEASQVQAQREASQAPDQRISISVEGEALGEVPLELFLTLQDSSVRIRRVEMLRQAGKTFGSSPCKATDNALVFKSILALEKVGRWWDAGESTSEGESRGVLRVYLQLDESGREVYRDMPVSIVEGLRNVGIATLVVWTIRGSI
jgi:hypothetical protein